MAGTIRTLTDQAYAYARSIMHPRTWLRTIVAFISGFFIVLIRALTYVAAQEMKELKEKNPTAWNEERHRRRFYLGVLLGIDALLLLALWVAKYKYTLPVNLQRFGPLIWAIGHAAGFIWVGRQDPILTRVQTKRMIGEELLRTITDEMTLTQAARKEGAASYITSPPHSLERTEGYRFTVRVHQLGNPVLMLTNLPTLCHKLQKGNGQVFTYQSEDDNSLITGVVLAENPWKKPATRNPLVMVPRPFNLWQEAVDLGTMPDLSAWIRTLISEGDGGGILVCGAPRKGKTVFIKNLLTYIMLDVGSNIHMIDGKDLDFPAIIPVAETYIGEDGMDDVELLHRSIVFLEGMKKEILRRKPLLKQLEAEHVTEEICKKLGLKLEWICIDELAVITQDLVATHKTEVLYFIDLLQYIVRMGPSFGVFCILATQRPNDKSVPDSIRSLITWKVAFYISTQAGSMAALGKAGPEYRADWLPHDPILFKGVALSIGDGRVRGHKITKQEFKSVCEYARVLRSQGVQAGDIVQQESSLDYPKIVKEIISVFEAQEVEKLSTVVILEALEEKGIKHDATSLSNALKPFGVSSRNVWISGKSPKGYRLEDLKKVHRIPSLVKSSPLGDASIAPPSGQPLYLTQTDPETDND